MRMMKLSRVGVARVTWHKDNPICLVNTSRKKTAEMYECWGDPRARVMTITMKQLGKMKTLRV